ncbi:hypothetical protein HG530_012090 [Fusarium avenaceum]|nr:hypothetical protein HG530_012090 [Fusarium avenaceum]
MICVPDPDLDPRASGISFATQKGSGAVADSLIRAAEQPRMLIAVPITYHTLKRPNGVLASSGFTAACVDRYVSRDNSGSLVLKCTNGSEKAMP